MLTQDISKLTNSQIKSQIIESTNALKQLIKKENDQPKSRITSDLHNDSSDDEVKDYLILKEPNYDEISHV